MAYIQANIKRFCKKNMLRFLFLEFMQVHATQLIHCEKFRYKTYFL